MRKIIWRNKLEDYILELYNNHRKTYEEIAQIIQKEKGILISREPVRKFINSKIAQAKTN